MHILFSIMYTHPHPKPLLLNDRPKTTSRHTHLRNLIHYTDCVLVLWQIPRARVIRYDAR
jgi:hypothetical protein